MRAAIVIAACALVALFGARARSAQSDTGPQISDADRVATLNFVGVAPQDRAWILASIAEARPEAQRLIAEVDGLVDMRTDLNSPTAIYPGADQAIGLTQYGGSGRATVALDVRRLDGDRAIDRPMVVLHELGHVIDLLLVDDDLMRQLDAGIPPAGPCQAAVDYGACTAVEERFADTFAKWALRGRFSLAGSGYGIPTPPSLEDWGQPLARLSLELGR
jgi:hypothetical protein